METLRAFLALPLPQAVLRVLENKVPRLRETAEKHGLSVSWVGVSQIHLTLVFLGDIPVESVGRASEAMIVAAREFDPFPLSLADWGVFPNLWRPRVLWVGVRDEGRVATALQGRLLAELKARGFTPDDKAFKAHLTLGRVRQAKHPGRDLALPAESPAQGAQPWSNTEVLLFKSDLSPQGAKHTVLARGPLGS